MAARQVGDEPRLYDTRKAAVCDRNDGSGCGIGQVAEPTPMRLRGNPAKLARSAGFGRVPYPPAGLPGRSPSARKCAISTIAQVSCWQ